MTKQRFTLLALALCLALAGCEKEYDDPNLGGIDALYLYPGMGYSVPLSGGSGDYAVSCDDPAIADFVVEYARGGASLRIEARAEGVELVTVTDTRSGKTAMCTLTVNKGNFASGWSIDEREYLVDAAPGAEIETELQSKQFPLGTTLSFDPHIEHPGRFGTGHWVVQKIENGVVDTLACGTFTSMPLDLNNIPKAYDNLPMEQDIHEARRYVFQQEDGEHVYDLFFVYTRESHGSLDRMMYEDRTEYYRAKYPNTRITSVVNRYVQRFHQ